MGDFSSARFSIANTDDRGMSSSEIRALLIIRLEAGASENLYPVGFNTVVSTNDYYTCYLIKNPTGLSIPGASWQSVNSFSNVEWTEGNVTNAEVDDGQFLYSHACSRYNDNYVTIPQDVSHQIVVGDELALCVQTWNNNAVVGGSIYWEELREVT